MITFTVKLALTAFFVVLFAIVLGVVSRSIHHPPIQPPARRRRPQP